MGGQKNDIQVKVYIINETERNKTKQKYYKNIERVREI